MTDKPVDKDPQNNVANADPSIKQVVQANNNSSVSGVLQVSGSINNSTIYIYVGNKKWKLPLSLFCGYSLIMCGYSLIIIFIAGSIPNPPYKPDYPPTRYYTTKIHKTSTLINVEDDFEVGFPDISQNAEILVFCKYDKRTCRNQIYSLPSSFIKKLEKKMPPSQLVNSKFNDFAPSLSPKTDKIAFIREKTNSKSVHISNIQDPNSSKEIATTDGNQLCWTPDGKKIAFLKKDIHSTNTYSIWTKEIDAEKPPVCLITGIIKNDCEVNFSFSPDESKIAFISGCDLKILDFANTQNLDPFEKNLLSVQNVTKASRDIGGFCWLNNNLIILSTARNNNFEPKLYLIDINTDTLPLTDDTNFIPIENTSSASPIFPTVTIDQTNNNSNNSNDISAFLLYKTSTKQANNDILLMNEKGETKKIINSSHEDVNPQFSPDGKQIAFASRQEDRKFEIYIYNLLSNKTDRITNRLKESGCPRWSPDGKQIIFDGLDENQIRNLYLINSDGTNLRQITFINKNLDRFQCAVPSWSKDGKSIYFTSNLPNNDFFASPKANLPEDYSKNPSLFNKNLENAYYIWRITADNQGAFNAKNSEKIAQGFEAFEFSSGNEMYLYFVKGESIPGLWKKKLSPPSSKDPLLVSEEKVRGCEEVSLGHWAISNKGIFFQNFALATCTEIPIHFYDFLTGNVKDINKQTLKTKAYWHGFSVTQDGKNFLFLKQNEAKYDLFFDHLIINKITND